MKKLFSIHDTNHTRVCSNRLVIIILIVCDKKSLRLYVSNDMHFVVRRRCQRNPSICLANINSYAVTIVHIENICYE